MQFAESEKEEREREQESRVELGKENCFEAKTREASSLQTD